MQSAEKGKELFEDLRKFSFDTTFGVDELASASSQLLNVGVSANVLQKDLKMLGDLAQGDKQKFQELTSIFAKVQSTGKASSMQLQQLALRGVPILQTLKDMGVEGTASAEQLTEAFKMLTGEGGQFHDAMDNIIDTIEGKRGFISDTLKEINVNFGKLIGLTDVYKKGLDILYNILDDVNNKLMEWNENPVMKALIQGTLITVITTLAGVLVATLIPALTTIVGLLATISPMILAGAGIGALIGVIASSITSVFSDANRYADELEEKIKNLKEIEKGLLGGGKLETGASSSDISKEVESLEATLKLYDEIGKLDRGQVVYKKEKWEQRITSANNSLELQKNALNKFKEEGNVEKVEEYNNKIKETENRIKILTNEYRALELAYNKALDEDLINNVIQSTKEALEVQKGYEKTLSVIESNNPYSKQLESINKLKDSLNDLEDVEKTKAISNISYDENGLPTFEYDLAINVDPSYKNKVDEARDYIKKQIDDIEIDISVKKQADWQKALQSAFGFTGKEVKDGATKSTVGAIEKFKEISKAQTKLFDKYSAGVYGTGSKKQDIQRENAQKLYEDLHKAFLEILSTVRDETYTGDEESLRLFEEEVIKARDALEQLEQSTSSFDFSQIVEEWKNSSNVGTMAGGYGMSALTSASGDASNFLQGLSQGGIWGAIINTLVGALANVASSCDNFERAMNPITTAFKKLKPLLSVLIDIGADVTTGIEQILNILQPVIKIIGVILRFLRLFGSAINVLLTLLSKLIDFLFSWLYQGVQVIEDTLANVFDTIDAFCGVEDEKTEEEKKQIEELKRAREAYASLLDAMKENEEWYIKQKTALNANTRKEGYQSVNDMILTPQGNFSTHPDDYIIATKNPQSLGGGAVVNVNIENNVSDVEVSATPVNRNGIQEIMIQISKKIADDVANGANGWDSALARQSSRQAGRQFSF